LASANYVSTTTGLTYLTSALAAVNYVSTTTLAGYSYATTGAALSAFSGAVTDAQVPDNITITNNATTGTFTAGDYLTLTSTDFDLDEEVITKTATMVFQNCTTTAKYAIGAFKIPKASTILEVGCSVDSGSSTIKSWEGTTAYASSTSIVNSLICTAGAGATTTTFVDSAMARDNFVGITITAISGATNTTAWVIYKPND
jgi:hypothetical protein